MELPTEQEFLSIFADDCDLYEIFDKCQRRATRKELQELDKYIGGFGYWTHIPAELKSEVITFLDFRTRSSLACCSKTDYLIESKTPTRIFSLKIYGDYHTEEGEETSQLTKVTIDFNYDPIKKNFYQSHSNLHVEFMKNEEGKIDVEYDIRSPRRKDTNYKYTIENGQLLDIVNEYVERAIFRSRKTIKDIYLYQYDYPWNTSRIKNFKNCKSIDISNNSETVLKTWLSKMDDQLDMIWFRGEDGDDTVEMSNDILSISKVQNAKHCFLSFVCLFSDESFLAFTGTQLVLSTVLLSDDVINQFFMRWARGKGVEDFEFLDIGVRQSDERNRAELLYGLRAKQWDTDFRQAQSAFCSETETNFSNGVKYQVYNRKVEGQSATIIITPDRIRFMVTGKPKIVNKCVITEYCLPSYYR